jgi:N-acetylglutamate synthase-like GNAT family acetyltransferase
MGRLLRSPLANSARAVGPGRGSERDSMDDSAFHLFLLDSARKPLACGRLHFNAPDEAQVRFMPVDENARGRGYGSRILEGLEAEATPRGAQKLVLDARDNVTEFYAKHDYAVVGEAERSSARFAMCGWRKLCRKIS